MAHPGEAEIMPETYGIRLSKELTKGASFRWMSLGEAMSLREERKIPHPKMKLTRKDRFQYCKEKAIPINDWPIW